MSDITLKEKKNTRIIKRRLRNPHQNLPSICPLVDMPFSLSNPLSETFVFICSLKPISLHRYRSGHGGLHWWHAQALRRSFTSTCPSPSPSLLHYGTTETSPTHHASQPQNLHFEFFVAEIFLIFWKHRSDGI